CSPDRCRRQDRMFDHELADALEGTTDLQELVHETVVEGSHFSDRSRSFWWRILTSSSIRRRPSSPFRISFVLRFTVSSDTSTGCAPLITLMLPRLSLMSSSGAREMAVFSRRRLVSPVVSSISCLSNL